MSKRIWGQLRDALSLREVASVIPQYLNQGSEQRITSIPPTIRVIDENHRYEYVSLPSVSESLHIRLLELLPESHGDPHVICRLTQHQHANCRGEYETLSYVWGDASEFIPIKIDGKFANITQNLYQALVDLRYQDEPRILWVDAICINQENTPERNQQVSAMGRIYQGARRVVVYLGPEYQNSTKTAYKLVDRFASKALQIGGLTEAITLSLLSQGSRIQHGISEKELLSMDIWSLRHLGSASWWTRAWTVQEVLLAPDALVVTGSYFMEWGRFCAGIDFGLRSGIIDIVTAGIMIDPIIQPYLSMHSLRMELETPIQPAAPDDSVSAQRLLALLISCRSRGATDCRDKVYAFLGLKDIDRSVPTSLDIEPDYATDYTEVYRNAAQQIILHSRCLDVLGACLPSIAADSMPTWVPDWSFTGLAPRPLMYDTFGGRRSSHASMPETRAPIFTDNNRTLILSGHRITTITGLSPVLRRPEEPGDPSWVIRLDKWFPLRLFRIIFVVPLAFLSLFLIYRNLLVIVEHLGVFADMEAFARDMSPMNPVTPPRTTIAQNLSVGQGQEGVEEEEEEEGVRDPLHVYWRTLCTGADAPGGPEETRKLFYIWRAKLGPMFKWHERGVDRWLPLIVLYTYMRTTWADFGVFARYLEMAYERRLAKGANGYLHLVPGHAEVGDQIVLVKEGKAPLLLRSGTDDGQVYRVVGETYVEGIMNGEAFREEDCAELRVH